MQDLFSTRHADYGRDKRINEFGKEQVWRLADYIQRVMDGRPIYLITSTAPRAVDCGEIIAFRFGLPDFEKLDYIWVANDAPNNSFYYEPFSKRDEANKKLIGIVEDRKDKADGIVVVSHKGGAERIGRHYLKELGISLRVGELTYGEGVHIDFVNKKGFLCPETVEITEDDNDDWLLNQF